MTQKIGIIEILKMSVRQIFSLAMHFSDEALLGEDFVYVPGSPKMPLLVAHADTVFSKPPKFIEYDRKRNCLRAPKGLGADDRAGIWAGLHLRKTLNPKPGLLFLDHEECGGAGAWSASVDLAEALSKYPYFLEIDRKGKGEAVYYNDEPEKFKRYIHSFGFHEEMGIFSDVSILGSELKKCSVNLSAGYYMNHHESEILVLHHLKYTVDRAKQICMDTYKTHPKFKLPNRKISMYNRYYRQGQFDWDERYDYREFQGRDRKEWKRGSSNGFSTRFLNGENPEADAYLPNKHQSSFHCYCDFCGELGDCYWSDFMQGYLCVPCWQRHALELQSPEWKPNSPSKQGRTRDKRPFDSDVNGRGDAD